MREKNSQKSREDILKAAEIEFSEKGIYGARIDEIAKKAKINIRMIYEYYGSKKDLYKAVLVEVYSRLGRMETSLLSEKKSSIDIIKELIILYFNYLEDNPAYVNLLLWENLNKGRYIQDIDLSGARNDSFGRLREIIEAGKADGTVKAAIDTEQVVTALLMYPFSYFSNKYTLTRLFGKSPDDRENIDKSIKNLTEMILTYITDHKE